MVTEPVSDQRSRDTIAEVLDEVLFVRAGAGTGKTTALVSRIVNLVTAGSVEITKIAAITFTDRAANELRYKIRDRLIETAKTRGDPLGVLRRAIDLLPSAPIGTIHSLATGLLHEFGFNLGLPLVFSISTAMEDTLLFESEWDRFASQLYDDPQVSQVLELLIDLGVSFTTIKDFAWDLDQALADLESFDHSSSIDVVDVVRRFESESLSFAARMQTITEHDDVFRRALSLSDRLAARIVELEAAGRELENAIKLRGPSAAILAFSEKSFPKMPSLKVLNVGTKANWDSGEHLNSLRTDITALKEEVAASGNRLTSVLAEFLFRRLVEFVSSLRQIRKSTGRINFNDLINLSLELVRSANDSLLDEIRSKYSVVLVDEFQDTDPVQIELVRRIANCLNDFENPNASSAAPLFFVGDPRQSIYRFRGADVDSYLNVAGEFPKERQVDLTVNFRSNSDITEWVSDVFEPIFEEVSGLSTGAIIGARAPIKGQDSVRLVSLEDVDDAGVNARELRATEAELCALAIRSLLDENTQIVSKGNLRSMTLGDIAVIIPTRAILSDLFRSFEKFGIEYVAANSSSLYHDELIRELFSVLRAAILPHDDLSVYHALTTSLLGVSMQDIFEMSTGSGSFRSLVEKIRKDARQKPERDPSIGFGSVGQGVSILESIRNHDMLYGCYAAIRYACEALVIYERAARSRNVEETWRRLDFVLNEARSWNENTSVTLRSYVEYVSRRVKDKVRVNESDGGELGVDAVTILTMHAAKGLEFPVVIVTGNSNSISGRSNEKSILVGEGGLGFRFNSSVATLNYADLAALEKEKEKQELVRLLYVATTRARDLLVITIPVNSDEVAALCNIKVDASSLFSDLNRIWQLFAKRSPVTSKCVKVLPSNISKSKSARAQPIEASDWLRARKHLMMAAMRPRSVSSTSAMANQTAIGSVRQPQSQSQPKGPMVRVSEIGIRVHECMARVPLNDIPAAIEFANDYLKLKDVGPAESNQVVEILKQVLSAESIQRVRNPYREMPISILLDDGETVLEAVLDLAYRAENSYQIVDYKIVRDLDDAYIETRMKRYIIQASIYKYALEKIVGVGKVSDVVFLLANSAGMREVRFDAWSAEVVEDYLSRAGKNWLEDLTGD